MKKKTVAFLAVIMLLSVFSPAMAEETKNLNTVEVTGSRVIEDIRDLPAQTYVLTQEEIAKSGATNLADALTRVPGITALDYNNGLAFTRGVKVRGFSTEVLVLVDGVQYTDPLHGADSVGAPNLNTIPVETIDRVEIVKGAGSAIYGSDAAGAVINVITKKGAEKSSGYAKLEGGNFGYFRGTLRGTAVEDGLKFTVGYSRTVESENIKYDIFGSKLEDYRADDYLLRIEKGNWAFTGNFGNGEAKYDSYSTWSGSFNQIGRKDNYARLNLTYNDGRNLGRIFYNKAEYDYPLDLNPSGLYYNDFDTESYGLTFNRKEEIGKTKLTWGADFRRDHVKYTNYFDPTADYDLNRHNAAPYVEANIALGAANLDLGLRYDYWNVNNGETENQFLPRVALSFANTNDTTFYASAGRTFSMPSFYEIMGEPSMWVMPNPNLKPEKGWSYEIGVKNEKAKNPWSFNLFYTKLDDAIIYDSDPVTWLGGYYNLSEKRAWGAEGKYTWNINDNWSYAQQLSYTKAEGKVTSASDWARTTDPRWDVAGYLNYKNGGFGAEVNYHYYADREFVAPAAGVNDGNILLVNASVKYSWNNETLRLACTNLFDKEYFTTKAGYYGAERRVIFSWQHSF